MNMVAAATAAKSLQSCPTLCNPIDGSPLGSSVPGILQARTLEWVAISFSNAWKWKGKVKSLSHARLLATPWTAACQAPLSMGFSRQGYWSGLPLPSPVTNSVDAIPRPASDARKYTLVSLLCYLFFLIIFCVFLTKCAFLWSLFLFLCFIPEMVLGLFLLWSWLILVALWSVLL